MATGLAANLRLTARLLCIVFVVVPVSLVEALFLAAVNAASPRWYRQLQSPMMRAWFGVLARLWGVRIEVVGRPVAAPAMLASNHRSWLDIVVLGATLSGSFVSKAEIDRWPVVGYLARHGGRTLYISRGELRSFEALGGTLIGRLRAGERIIFFPEGTVSDDQLLLRFRPRLFAGAIAAGCPVQPLALAYRGGDRAALAPLGQTEKFAWHALRLLRCRWVGVRLEFLAPLASAGADPKALAAEAQAAVRTALEALPARGQGAFTATLERPERETPPQ